jgi:hypothetical protein
MRFMMVVIRKGFETAAADAAPGAEAVARLKGVQQEPAESRRTAGARWALSAVNWSACFLCRRQSHHRGWTVR